MAGRAPGRRSGADSLAGGRADVSAAAAWLRRQAGARLAAPAPALLLPNNPPNRCCCPRGCRQVQRVLRVTAGVRQESLVRLGRLDSGLAHNAYLQEQAAAAESAAAGSRGRRPARGSVGGADDRHLARGERLTPAQQTAAQLASHLSAPDGLLTVAPMLSAPLIARLSSLRAARSVSRRPLQLRRARSLSPLKRVGAAAVHQDGLVSGQRVADVV